jgi:thiamine-phosphate pyrophosphorylase
LRPFPSRLYAILDVDISRSRGLAPADLLSAWLDADVQLVQLRAKTLAGGPLLALADDLVARTRAAGARLIVNDRADVAVMADADGVHVGQHDLAPAAVRTLVGEERWVGLSTHSDLQVESGCGAPVTYLALGPVFPTASKTASETVVGLEGVRRAAARARASGLPLVAIGGITLATAPAVIAAGADAVAVISDLLAGAPEVRARQYLKALVTLTL